MSAEKSSREHNKDNDTLTQEDQEERDVTELECSSSEVQENDNFCGSDVMELNTDVSKVADEEYKSLVQETMSLKRELDRVQSHVLDNRYEVTEDEYEEFLKETAENLDSDKKNKQQSSPCDETTSKAIEQKEEKEIEAAISEIISEEMENFQDSEESKESEENHPKEDSIVDQFVNNVGRGLFLFRQKVFDIVDDIRKKKGQNDAPIIPQKEESTSNFLSQEFLGKASTRSIVESAFHRKSGTKEL